MKNLYRVYRLECQYRGTYSVQVLLVFAESNDDALNQVKDNYVKFDESRYVPEIPIEYKSEIFNAAHELTEQITKPFKPLQVAGYSYQKYKTIDD